jgi:hypothetical protein
MLVILRDAVPKLVSVTDCAVLVVPTTWVAKVRLSVDRVALGPEKNPVPFKAISCGLPAVLSMMVTEAVRGPLSVGAKVTVMVHLPPDGRLESHVLIWLKSLAFVPVTATLLMVNVRAPVFVSVTVWGALIVPTAWGAKVRLVFESESVVACSRTETVAVLESATAMSSLPSSLKSPTATELGPAPAA